MQNTVAVKADNVVCGRRVAPDELAVVYDETVGNAALAAAVRVIEAACIYAAERAVFSRHLTESKSDCSLAVGVGHAEENALRVGYLHDNAVEAFLLYLYYLDAVARILGLGICGNIRLSGVRFGLFVDADERRIGSLIVTCRRLLLRRENCVHFVVRQEYVREKARRARLLDRQHEQTLRAR